MKKNTKFMQRIGVSSLIFIIFSNLCFSQVDIEKNKANGKLSSPSLTVINEKNEKQSLQISKLLIDIKIVGKLAVTTIDITFRNNLDRILEGELDFPLSDGQSVSRFAMELNGKLREGVVVEKAKGRIAYEKTIRQRIDPALLEMTQGNSFRSRVYPIPAEGEKRIVIAYEELIRENEEGMIYQLPLNYKDEIEQFKLFAKIYNDELLEKGTGKQFDNLKIQKDGSAYLIGVEYENYLANQQFELLLKSPENKRTVMVEEIKDKTYFYIDLNTEFGFREKKLPETLGILWDASNSSLNRNIDNEIELLKSYIGKIKNCKVHFILFSNAIHTEKEFIINNGNIQELENYIRKIEYDGGTQLGILNLKQYKVAEFLLFSDGMSNFGKKEIELGNSPIYTINSNQVANHSYLKFIPQISGGNYINLLNMSYEKAQEVLSTSPYQFISAEYSNNDIEQTYPSIPQIVDGSFILTGLLKTEKALVKLNFGYGNEITHSEFIEIDEDEFRTETELIGRIWAQKKIAELDMMYEKNKEEIKQLGKKFNLITKGTSLIVFDRVEDYVRYKIEPPEELRNEYEELLEKEYVRTVQDSIQYCNNVISNFKKENDWWNKKFDEKFIKNDNYSIRSSVSRQVITDISGNATLTGTVKNKNGMELLGATILIEGTQKGMVIRNRDGSFMLRNLPVGTFTTKVSFIGLKTLRREIVLDSNSTVNIDFELEEDTCRNTQAVMCISSDRMISDRDTNSNVLVSTYATEEVQRNNSGREDLSGVIALSDGAVNSGDGLNLNEEQEEGNQIIVDGVEVTEQFTGGFAAEYGNVTGGIVTTTRVVHDTVHTAREGQDYNGSENGIDIDTETHIEGDMLLKNWEPVDEIIKKISESAKDSSYIIYLNYKKSKIDKISFYIDAADALFKTGDTINAIRVISNLSEIKIDNHETMRILGYKLKQMGLIDLSIMIFTELIKIREEEPQSYRDLALEFSENGQYQEAADLFYNVAFTKWDRFFGIDIIALNEMNRLIALYPDKIKIDKYNPDLIKNMPIDIRVVLIWDTDNTDIDLMLTSPSGSICDYRTKLTYEGCKISNDFTAGYGPEEIKLKNALPGKYIIEANYFGNRRQNTQEETTISLEIYTKYASKEEKKSEITLRLQKKKEKIKIGEFIFK